MDLDLPKLDIVEDIEDIMNDSEDVVEIEPPEIISPEQHEELLEIEAEKKQPFVKKVKKKKELSEKQIAHLEKIRGMALEKRRAKARAKKEAVDKVTAEVSEQHKPKYYKPKPKKTAEEKALEKEAKRKYKKQTMEVDNEVVKSEVDETTPEDFVPTHKAVEREKKEKQIFNQQDSFNHFMGNMENYLKMRDAYQEQKLSKNQNDAFKGKSLTTPSRTEPPVTRSKSKAKAGGSGSPRIPTILKPAVESPFSNYFG